MIVSSHPLHVMINHYSAIRSEVMYLSVSLRDVTRDGYIIMGSSYYVNMFVV